MSEILHQFRLINDSISSFDDRFDQFETTINNDINDRFDQFGTTIKDSMSSMIDKNASTSTQDIDYHMHQKMDRCIRLLEDELGTKLAEKIKNNETKATSKLSELHSKLLIQIKSIDNKITSRLT